METFCNFPLCLAFPRVSDDRVEENSAFVVSFKL